MSRPRIRRGAWLLVLLAGCAGAPKQDAVQLRLEAALRALDEDPSLGPLA